MVLGALGPPVKSAVKSEPTWGPPVKTVKTVKLEPCLGGGVKPVKCPSNLFSLRGPYDPPIYGYAGRGGCPPAPPYCK